MMHEMGRTGRLHRLAGLCACIMVLAISAAWPQGRKVPPARPGYPQGLPGFGPSRIPAVNQPVVPAYMKIRVEGDRVTADIRSTPLQQVLEEFANRTGLVFEVQTQENPAIFLSLYHVTLLEAIQRILAGENSIFYYDQDIAGTSRVAFVRVFPRGNQLPQPSLRYIGTGAITKSGDDTVETPEQALKALAESQNLETRQKAVEVLVKIKSPVTVEALASVLNDPAPEIRSAAIEGLASLGARNELPDIVKALKDQHPGVRQSAVAAVSWMGDADNIKDLKPLGRDKDASVAAAAEIAMRKLSSARRP